MIETVQTNQNKLVLRREINRLLKKYGEYEVTHLLKELSKTPAMGDFVWFIFPLEGSPEDFYKLKSGELSRLMYLVTKSTTHGIIKSGSKVIARPNLKDILSISRVHTKRFYEATTENGYLVDDDYLRITADFFRRDCLTPSDYKTLRNDHKCVTRMFFPAIRGLYKSPDHNTNQTLNFLYKLIPRVNLRYNIVCHDIFESDLNEIIPMKIGEVCDAVGYSKTKSSRLLGVLVNAKFLVDNHYERVFVKSQDNHLFGGKTFFRLNPRVFYAGDAATAEEIVKGFRIDEDAM